MVAERAVEYPTRPVTSGSRIRKLASRHEVARAAKLSEAIGVTMSIGADDIEAIVRMQASVGS